MQTRAAELGRIIDRILLSSRIEAGRAQIAMRGVALEAIVRDRTEALRSASGRDVRAEVAGAVPDALADPAAFTTVLDHLLDNALKYSPHGGTVAVTLRGAGDRIELRVADQGIGMTPEQATRCFDRFWQADSGDARRFGGTGIGLHIVRSLVLAMGGDIGVETAPGRGSTFLVTLQRADRPDELAALTQAMLGGSAT
jgi:signal transduction histidine kinase